MSSDLDPANPEQGDEYVWPDGEREVVTFTLPDGQVCTLVVYPTEESFEETVTQEGIEPVGVNQDVKSLPDIEWFENLELPDE